MGQTYYCQHPCDEDGCKPGFRTPTVTVRELREQLAALPDDLPVIYRMPEFGVFGGGVCHAIEGAAYEKLDASEIEHPASDWFDEETGGTVQQEAYVDRLAEWEGVVLL